MFEDIEFPHIGLLANMLVNQPVDDLEADLIGQLDTLAFSEKLKRGDRIAISAGSRGIRNIDQILSLTVSYLSGLGFAPFIFPAMGSHGGATAEGQMNLLAKLNISEKKTKAPILSSMDVEKIGETNEGMSVFADRHACQADGILIINRIKPHTKFKGPLESGLCKMCCIGIGKHQGAQYYHKYALKYGFSEVIESVARVAIEKLPIVGGLAIIEDGHDQTALIKALPPEDIIEKEKELLCIAKDYMPKLPFEDIDVLIVDQIGKDISGAGMDYNIIGRNRDIMNRWHTRQKIKRIFVRDLTKNSYGNGLGIGMADFITDRIVDQLNCQAMYTNALTASGPESAMIPIHFPTDRQALAASLGTIGPVSPREVRLVWIKDTLSLETVAVSEFLFHDASKRKDLSPAAGIGEIKFDPRGNLISPFAA